MSDLSSNLIRLTLNRTNRGLFKILKSRIFIPFVSNIVKFGPKDNDRYDSHVYYFPILKLSNAKNLINEVSYQIQIRPCGN